MLQTEDQNVNSTNCSVVVLSPVNTLSFVLTSSILLKFLSLGRSCRARAGGMATSFRSQEVRSRHCGAIRCGKAQLSLERILGVIASCGGGGERRGVDLNLAAAVDCENGEEAEALVEVVAGGSGVAEEGDVGSKASCDGRGGYLNLLIEAAQQVAGGFKEAEEREGPSVSHESTRISNESGSDGSVQKSQGSKGSRQRGDWTMMAEDMDMSPIVRSKRGRTQVLPYRYRDSVIERSAGEMKRRLRRGYGEGS